MMYDVRVWLSAFLIPLFRWGLLPARPVPPRNARRGMSEARFVHSPSPRQGRYRRLRMGARAQDAAAIFGVLHWPYFMNSS